MNNQKILIVDDEEVLLKSIQRIHDDDYDITTALGPAEALEVFEQEGPFAVVVSDMRMPGMNGVELLTEIERRDPSAVKMMLTGFSELKTTVKAINQGQLFRFLTKPCDDDDFAAALDAGLRQFDLMQMEQELLEKTLCDSVQLMQDVLALTNPDTFCYSQQVLRFTRGMLKHLKVANAWEIELAAMLASIGTVAVPENLNASKSESPISNENVKQIRNLPKFAAKLVKRIPRMEQVARHIRTIAKEPGKKTPAVGSQILAIANSFATATHVDQSTIQEAANTTRKLFEGFDAAVLNAFDQLVSGLLEAKSQSTTISELQPGMVLNQDVNNEAGERIMRSGQILSGAAIELLRNLDGFGRDANLDVFRTTHSDID